MAWRGARAGQARTSSASREQLWPPRAAPASDPEREGGVAGGRKLLSAAGCLQRGACCGVTMSQSLSPGAPLTRQCCLGPTSTAACVAVKSSHGGQREAVQEAGAWAPPGEEAAKGTQVSGLPHRPLRSSRHRPCAPVHTHPGTACPTCQRQHRATGGAGARVPGGGPVLHLRPPRACARPAEKPSLGPMALVAGRSGRWGRGMLQLGPLPASAAPSAGPAPAPLLQRIPQHHPGSGQKVTKRRPRVFAFHTNQNSKRSSGLEATAREPRAADAPGAPPGHVPRRKGGPGAVAALFWGVSGAAAPAQAGARRQGRSGPSGAVCRLTG